MTDFIKTKIIWFLISGGLVVISLVFFGLGGLKLGIDFSGGTLYRVNFPKLKDTTVILKTIEDINLGQAGIRTVSGSDVQIKMGFLTQDKHEELFSKFKELDPGVAEISIETIGPAIGQELKKRSQVAIAVVLIMIVLYISWAFRHVSQGPVRSWVYGLAAIIALFHDILIVIGVFSVLGYFFDVEVDILFVTALLTILGFSVHDTIVVFDRIRERIKQFPNLPFGQVINESILSTASRSINTSLTTLLVLVSLLVFGGESIRFFALALTIGIIIGTYSSIFIASPLLFVYGRIMKKV